MYERPFERARRRGRGSFQPADATRVFGRRDTFAAIKYFEIGYLIHKKTLAVARRSLPGNAGVRRAILFGMLVGRAAAARDIAGLEMPANLRVSLCEVE